MSMESVTLEWMQNLQRTAVPLTILGTLSKTGQLTAYYEMLLATIDAQAAARAAPFAASAGGGAIAAGAIPVAVAVGVWVALGAGYYQARQIVRQENTMSGFSQGLVCGLLRWTYDQTLDRFRRPTLHINQFDRQTDEIRVTSYIEGLRKGFTAGTLMPRAAVKPFLARLRQLANLPPMTAEDWNGRRNTQISYVIALAGAGRRHGLVRPE